MAAETYGRGQLEWALWRSFTRGRRETPIPKIFRTRIKRLIDLDRDFDLSDLEVQPEASHAFAPPPEAGTTEAAYEPIDGLCLAIALDLLDAGFKQAEIVFLMRYLRADLDKRFERLLRAPSLLSRSRYRAADYPDVPSMEHRGQHYADNRVFLIIRKVELTEIAPKLQESQRAGPVFLEPVFCEGVGALTTALDGLLPNRQRAATIVEIAATAQAVQAFLKQSPPIRRGRPKA